MSSAALAQTGGIAPHAAAASTPRALCAVSAVVVSIKGAVGRGGCTLKGRPVPVKWTWAARSEDADGVACGTSQSGTGSNVIFTRLLPYTEAVTFKAAPARGPGKAASKSARVTLGSPYGSCAALTPKLVPPSSTLCTWTDNSWLASGGFCGAPATLGPSACGWISPITLEANTVNAGRFACVSGDCRVSGLAPSKKPGLFGASATHDGNFFCGPKRLDIALVVVGIQLTDRSGKTCGTDSTRQDPLSNDRETITGSLTLPASFGGTLRIAYLLKTYVGAAMETAQFTLGGSADCSAFTL
jgi:hypothetical protein